MLDNLTLDHLRALIAVAETGSFSGAGRRLGRVQSAISQSIQAMEVSLGLQLFDRTHKKPGLTDAGRAMLAHARQVLSDTNALRAHAVALAAGMEAGLTLAVDNLFPLSPLLASLRALEREFPELPVTLYTASLFASERRVREGGASIALCGLQPGKPIDLVARTLTYIELIPVVSPSHPLGQIQGEVSRDVLGRYIQLVLTDPSEAPDGQSFGVVSSRVWRFVDLAPRLEFLRAGFGWCNMPRHVVAPLVASGELVQLAFAEASQMPPRLPMHAVHARERPPGPAGRWFIDRLFKACQIDDAKDPRLT